MTPADLPRLPVEQLAQFLLGCAREDPALLARSSTESIIPVDRRKRVDLNNPSDLLSLKRAAAGLRSNPEMEELVSIAVACARRAEDACQQAREISWMARRRMSVVAGVTGAGLLAGTVALVFERHNAAADPRMTEVASAVQNVNDLQKMTVAQLAEVRTDVAAIRDSTPPADSPVEPSAPVVAPVAPAVAPVAAPAPIEVASAAAIPEPRKPDELRPPDPVTPATVPQPAPPKARPSHPYRYADHGYRQPYRQVRGSPFILAQVVENVRRNIYNIFH